MEVKESTYTINLKLFSLKEKPIIDIEDLENEIKSYLEDNFDYEVEIETEFQKKEIPEFTVEDFSVSALERKLG